MTPAPLPARPSPPTPPPPPPSTGLTELQDTEPSSPSSSSSSGTTRHPFEALLTPYQASNPQPPSAPPPPPLPSLTLRCLMLSSSIPPPPAHHPFVPYTPYSPPPVPSDDDNTTAFRAACWRKRDLTKDDWARERRGVERWIRWAEGKELVLISGQDAVRRFCLEGEGEGFPSMSRPSRGKKLAEDEYRSTSGNIPQIGEWVSGQADLVQPFPIHTPLLGLLRASSRVTDTVTYMVSSYYRSFVNGTQAAALQLVWERGPIAVDYLFEKVPEAWRNVGVNLKRLSTGGGES